ncbi:hypothetical protein CBW53_12115 [Yersinia frederiksenii]|nr:hypothetical protein CBW53_12115 [Yersinia frederiksenii]
MESLTFKFFSASYLWEHKYRGMNKNRQKNEEISGMAKITEVVAFSSINLAGMSSPPFVLGATALLAALTPPNH